MSSGEDDDDDANDQKNLNAKLLVAEQKLVALLSTSRGQQALQVCMQICMYRYSTRSLYHTHTHTHTHVTLVGPDAPLWKRHH